MTVSRLARSKATTKILAYALVAVSVSLVCKSLSLPLTLLTVSVNSFTVLEYDVPAPSIPTVAEFTFTHPPPSRSSDLQAVRDFTTRPLPLSLTPPDLSALTLSSEWDESWIPGQCHTIINESTLGRPVRPRPWSPGLPSMPNSPPILPRVLLTVDSGYKTSSVPNLDQVKIPSPLLYHKKSQDTFASSEHTERDGPFTAFHLTGQSSQAEIAEHNEMVISAVFRNVPQPPWILTSKQGTPMSTPTADATVTTEAPSYFLTPNGNDAGLIFPVIEAAATGMPDAEPQNGAGLPESRSPFIEEDPQTIERMWNAFEAVVGSPRDRDRMSSWSFSPEASTESDLSGESPATSATIPNGIDVGVCSTPACTALVPARLYHHHYSDWPQWHVHEYRESLFSFLGAIPQSMPSTSILKKWCEDAGFEDRHVEPCRNDAGQVSSPADEPSDIITDDVQDSESCMEVGTVDPISSPSYSHEHDPISEHDSAYDSASEILQEEAMWSEDEWADLDWDEDPAWKFDDADMEQSDEETPWHEVHQRLA